VAAAAICGGGVVAVDRADAGRGRCLEGSIDPEPERYFSLSSDRWAHGQKRPQTLKKYTNGIKKRKIQ
jgi:hypothetical protein